jgi:hypothetical protein
MVDQFVQGREYLKAVSPKTLIWYQCSFKAFDGATSCEEAIIVRTHARSILPGEPPNAIRLLFYQQEITLANHARLVAGVEIHFE